jgi:hypothetical protein
MPVSWAHDLAGQRTIVTLTDPYSFQEWEETVAAMIAARACEPRGHFLVDRRQSAPPTTEFVRRMSETFVEHVVTIGRARVAVVVDSEAGFGMARMSQLLAEAQTPAVTIRAFRSYTEAERWLGTGAASASVEPSDR